MKTILHLSKSAYKVSMIFLVLEKDRQKNDNDNDNKNDKGYYKRQRNMFSYRVKGNYGASTLVCKGKGLDFFPNNAWDWPNLSG